MSSLPSFATPWSIFFKETADIFFYLPLSALCLYKTPNVQSLSVFQPHAHCGALLGYESLLILLIYDWDKYSVVKSCNVAFYINCPKRMVEALRSEHGEQWKKAGQYEIPKLKEHNVYDLVELPRGEHLIGNQWVLAVKSNGTFRARVVAKGYSQSLELTSILTEHTLPWPKLCLSVSCLE